MSIRSRFSTFLILGALSVSSCAPGTEAPHDIVLSGAPDGHGVLILGAADENARTSLFFVTMAFGVNLVRADGKVIRISRQGCDTPKGLITGQSCASDREIAEHVVEVPPGDWQIESISERIQRGVPARIEDIDQKLPPGITVHVGPGEVVYAGDFLFNIDQDTLQGRLKTYSRNDAAAAQALAAYPGLNHGFVYREPSHPVTGRS